MIALLNDGDARRSVAEDAVAVPHLADPEIAYAIRAQVLRGRITAADGWSALAGWMRLGLRRFPIAGLLPRIWDLRDNLTAYDATYVALAEALDCPLLTGDARLATAPGPDCPITVVRR